MSAERDNARMSFFFAVAFSIAWIIGTAGTERTDTSAWHRLADNLLIWIAGGGFLATWNKWKGTK